MSPHPLIERITKGLSACVPGDAGSLQALRMPLIETCQLLGSRSGSSALASARAALQHLERLLEHPDEADAFRTLREAVSKLAAEPDPFGPEGAKPGAGARIDVELLTMFLRSSDDSISKIESTVLALEAPGENQEGLAQLRRLVHTLKGECGVIPLPEAQQLLHEAESLIDRHSEAGLRCPTDPLFEVIDWMKGYLPTLSEENPAPTAAAGGLIARLRTFPKAGEEAQQLASSTPAGDSQARVVFSSEVFQDPTIVEFIPETRAHIEEAEAALLAVEQDPTNIETIDSIFRTFHTIKGVASFLQMGAMADLAHKTEALLDEFRKQRLVCRPEHTSLLFEACDVMSAMVDYLAGSDAPYCSVVDELIRKLVHAASGTDPNAATPPLKDVLVEAPKPGAAKVPPSTGGGAGSGAKAPAIAADANATKRSKELRDSLSRKAAAADNTVKVATERLDALVDMVGELVIAQQMVHQDPEILSIKSPTLQRNLTQVAKITRNLQESSMSLRTVTLRSTFQKMSRLARDVAQKSRKLVQFETEGEDTELDRNVVEEISDPLVHLIRNSIDHGVELPADRLAAGKAERGVVRLKAYHQGGSIVIEIADDGRGLSRERILAKAIERNLLPPNVNPSDLPDAEVHRMIFLPGFSTAEKVTDISGRGVGMDVVRRNIESMRGKIEIHSHPGRGSQFILRLPLTLAIIDGMIIRVGHARYVVPTLTVEQSFRPLPSQLHSVLGKGEMVDVRGCLLPIMRLTELLDHQHEYRPPTDAILIAVESNGKRACLLADELLSQQQVVIKSLGTALPPMPFISGGAILGNGRVALILDIDAVLAETERVPA